MNLCAPALLLILAAALAAPAGAAEDLAVTARPLSLNPDDLSQDRVGMLIWRGGLELTSPSADFGGISGLLVSADGAALTAVTDRGKLIGARLDYNGMGHLAGLGAARLEPLTGPDGVALDGKVQQDAESLALPDATSLLVSFEQRHRLYRYPLGPAGLAGPAEPFAPAPGLEGLPHNKGVEALVSLGGGRLLAITQGRDAEPDIRAFLLQDGAWSMLSYPREGLFKPTGAARLPDGDVIVLERRFTLLGGLAVRLVRIAAAEVRPGAALGGQELARLGPPLSVDNMEGIAALRGPGGETLIYLVSDDNFHPLQRTLLLMFELAE